MIPILYQPKETDFTTYGIGTLSDCQRCEVTEERNGIFECEFDYPLDGILFDEIQNDCIVKVKANEDSNEQLFRIYNNTKPLNGICTFYAEHISYQLNHIPVSPFVAGSAPDAAAKLKDWSAADNPFTFWTNLGTIARMEVEVPTSCRSLLGGTEGSFLDVYGGEFEFDNFNINIHKQRGQDTGVVIEYGKNLTDLTQEESIETVVTGVYPYYKTEEVYVDLGENKIISVASDYAFAHIIPLDLSSEFEELEDGAIPTQEQVRQKATEYINSGLVLTPKVSLTFDFVHLWKAKEHEILGLLERVSLCDIVTVRYPKLGVDVKAKVIKTVFDTLTERYTEIEIGEARSTFADTIADTEKKIEEIRKETSAFPEIWEKAISDATSQLTGQKGGYLVINDPENPREILIMDTDNMATARKVLRLNLAGIGGSTNGINGPYELAMLLDGSINANKITVGTLNANVIRAGIITDYAGKSSWNLDTGMFNMTGQFYQKHANGNDSVAIYDSAVRFYDWSRDGSYKGFLWCDTYNGDPDIQLRYIGTGSISIGKSGATPHIWLQDWGGVKRGEQVVFNSEIHCDGYAAFMDDVYVLGNLSVTGSKSRLVDTSKGKTSMNAYETAECYFGDIGESEISDTGECTIEIDPILLETISTEHSYQVFLQAYGDGKLWVDSRNEESFVVKGTAGLKFAWELKAKQKGYESDRLEVVDVGKQTKNNA